MASLPLFPLGTVLMPGARLPLQIFEDRYIAWILERVGGNKTRASEILQIDPSTLYRRGRNRKP